MARLIVSGMLSIPEISSNFVPTTSMSPKLKLITLIKSVVSPCASCSRISNTRLRYASYPFRSGASHTIFLGPFRRQQCQNTAERPRPLVPSFVCRDSLHSWFCCYRLQLEACQRNFPVLKAVGLFSRATSVAIVTVLTAPTVD